MDVVSLLRLLKELLPPEAYENIARFILDLMESEDPAAFARLAPIILEWARTHYPQYLKLIELILERVRPGAGPTPPPAPPTPPPEPPPVAGGGGWINVARFGVYAALAYLLIAAVADSQKELKHPPAGHGPCATNVQPVPLETDDWSYGPKTALDAVLTKIAGMCADQRLPCTDQECPTCAPDAAVQTVEVKTRVFWYTAVVSARCQCWCK